MITIAINEKLKDLSATARRKFEIPISGWGEELITVKLSIHANGGICANKSAKSSLFFTPLLCNGKQIRLKERVKYRLQLL
jgi:hypothetical protein